MFKRILSIFLLVFFACVVRGQNTANVSYTITDFTSVPQAYSLLTMNPLFPYGINGPAIVSSLGQTQIIGTDYG